MIVETKLTKEFERRMDELSKMNLDSDKYESAVNSTTKIADRLIEIEKAKKEPDKKKTQLVGYAIEVLKVGLPLTAAFFMGLISMNWEDRNIQTSTAGKASFRDLIRFK